MNTHDSLTLKAHKRPCLRCGTQPPIPIAYIDGAKTLKCACYPKPPLLGQPVTLRRYLEQRERGLVANQGHRTRTLTEAEVEQGTKDLFGG